MAIAEVLSLVVIETCFCGFVAVKTYFPGASLLKELGVAHWTGPTRPPSCSAEIPYSIT